METRYTITQNGFSSGARVKKEDIKISGPIYPFLPDITNYLKSHFIGTNYEHLFCGNFVDRTQVIDVGKLSKHLVWDPLQLEQYPERKEGKNIYCVLASTVTQLEQLLKDATLSLKVKYYLTLYMDIHIPLILYLEDLICKQRDVLINITNHYVIDEWKDLISESQKELRAIHKVPAVEKRFDMFLQFHPEVLTDEFLLTQVGEAEPQVLTLMPSQELFDTDKLFHEGLLPDVLHYIIQCSFFSDTKKSNPLVHLISKSLPQRCTIRNLREILSSYSRKYDAVYTFVLGCMKASLLGLYKHSTVRPGFAVRKTLIKMFKETSKVEFLQWMLSDHQQLLFYIIKEFLVFACRKIPSIYAEIQRRYYWGKFETCVMNAMNQVRKFERFDHSNPLLFTSVEQLLQQINKQQIHHLYRPARSTFALTVVQECERIDEQNCVQKPTQQFRREYKELMYQLAIRLDEREVVPFHLLKFFNVDKEIIAQLSQIQEIFLEEGSKTSLKSFLHGLERLQFETIRDLCDSWDRKMNVRIFTLPVHAYIQQYRALRRKHKIPNGEELPEDEVGNCFVCFHCKTFKSFYNCHDNKGKPQNIFAYGHPKMLVQFDEATDKLMLYCGRRCDKHDGKKRQNYNNDINGFINVEENVIKRQSMERARKRRSKEIRKETRNNICAQTEVVKISLLGRVLQFYKNLYTICCKCGNIMQYTGKYFNEDGFYCGCCLSAGGKLFTNIACEYCNAIKHNESWDPLVIADEEEEGKTHQIYLCNSCMKPWIQNANQLLKWSQIMKGLMEKWKKLKHPSNI